MKFYVKKKDGPESTISRVYKVSHNLPTEFLLFMDFDGDKKFIWVPASECEPIDPQVQPPVSHEPFDVLHARLDEHAMDINELKDRFYNYVKNFASHMDVYHEVTPVKIAEQTGKLFETIEVLSKKIDQIEERSNKRTDRAFEVTNKVSRDHVKDYHAKKKPVKKSGN